MSIPSRPIEPTYGLAEAARVCGVSKPTVRRRKGALVAAGASAEESGWRIPAGALVAAGLLDGDAVTPSRATRSLTPVTALPVPVADTQSVTWSATPAEAARVRELEAELADVRRALAAAEARAEERDRCLRVLEEALSTLGRGRSDTGAGTPVKPAPAARSAATGSGPGWRSPRSWTHPTARGSQ